MFCNSINFWEIRDFDLNLRINNFCILQNWPIRINHTIEAGQVIFIASECVQVTNQNLEIKHCLSALLSKIFIRQKRLTLGGRNCLFGGLAILFTMVPKSFSMKLLLPLLVKNSSPMSPALLESVDLLPRLVKNSSPISERLPRLVKNSSSISPDRFLPLLM